MSHCEIIIKNKINSSLGWDILEDKSRAIRIGNKKNCNDDGLIPCTHIKYDIEKIFKKFNIDDYIINEINTNDEFSYQILLNENIYELFKNRLNDNNYLKSSTYSSNNLIYENIIV